MVNAAKPLKRLGVQQNSLAVIKNHTHRVSRSNESDSYALLGHTTKHWYSSIFRFCADHPNWASLACAFSLWGAEFCGWVPPVMRREGTAVASTFESQSHVTEERSLTHLPYETFIKDGVLSFAVPFVFDVDDCIYTGNLRNLIINHGFRFADPTRPDGIMSSDATQAELERVTNYAAGEARTYKHNRHSFKVELVKKISNAEGKSITVRLKVEPNDDEQAYKHAGNALVPHALVSGHSGLGKTVRKNIEHAVPSNARMLIIESSCSTIFWASDVHDKFPNAIVIHTLDMSENRNNSLSKKTGEYLRVTDDEGIDAFMCVIERIAKAALDGDTDAVSLATLQTRLDEISQRWGHPVRNWIVPGADARNERTLLRNMDANHNGVADSEESTPLRASSASERAAAKRFFSAVQGVNNLLPYSETFGVDFRHGAIVAGGFFEAKDGESQLFRWRMRAEDGEPRFVLQASDKLRDESEETLRALIAFAFARAAHALTDRPGGDPMLEVSQRLVLAGSAIAWDNTDASFEWGKERTWKRFLELAGLPMKIPYSGSSGANGSQKDGIKERVLDAFNGTRNFWAGSMMTEMQVQALLEYDEALAQELLNWHGSTPAIDRM